MLTISRLGSIAVIAVLAGCSGTVAPPSVVPPPTLKYFLAIQNLRPIDTSHEQYVLWLRVKPNEGWVSVALSKWQRGISSDSLIFSSGFQSSFTPDSVDRAVLSIEPMTIPQTPTSILIAGAVTRDTGNLSTLDAAAVGDFSAASGSALFTTRSSDTNRARNEFYLMQFSGGISQSSVNGLPHAPAGWMYGLWVLDINFFPAHQFVYGYFSSPTGPDTNATNNAYPFPGGYNPAPLTDGGARIAVTLEAISSLTQPIPHTPSPIEILSLPLRRFISFNDTIQFSDVWSGSQPSGTLRLSW